MLTQDKLWKAVFEDFFPEAITFYFPLFYPLIDWARGYEILDKELRQIFPESEETHRRVDLLVKVWLLDGTERWILIHVEVQGYRDDDFPRRMFIYFYRLTDRFNVPVSALALLTDSDEAWKPDRYEYKFMETELTYKYPIYKLAAKKEADFEGKDNFWAIVMKAALLGLKKSWKDEVLFKKKIRLYREFREKGFSKEQVLALRAFLKQYVRFAKPEFYNKFDEEIQGIENQKSETMGLIELGKIDYEESTRRLIFRQGVKEGIEQGIEKGAFLTARKIVMRLMQKNPSWTDAEIAEQVEMPVQFVSELRQEMKEKNEN